MYGIFNLMSNKLYKMYALYDISGGY